jgi:Na+/melibiose symporter-like transporter
LNVLLAAGAVIGTLRFVPESADPEAPPLDLGGAAISVLALVALVFSVIEAPSHGWLAARTLVGLALAVVLLAAFVAWELRQATPLLDPRVFGQRALSAGSLTIFIQFLAFFGYTFVVLQYLQFVRGDTPLAAAVQVLPLALALMPTSRLAPRLTARFGTRWVCGAGLALLAGGLAIMSQLQADSSYWVMLIGLIVIGAGMGAAMTPATSAITETLPSAQQGVGSALNDLSREVGGAIGIAVIGSVLASSYSGNVDVAGLPGRVAATVKESVAIASHLGGAISQHADAAFVSAMHVALLTASGVALAAAALVVALLSRRPVELSAQLTAW